jgi:MFS family permease
MGIMYLGAPFVFGALQVWPKARGIVGPIGLFIITLSMVTSSFSTKVWHLIITQGVLYAIGGSLLYAPAIFYLDEWFIKRKGLAFGVMWAGTGTSGIIVPFVMTWGLNSYGFRTMLRAWAVVLIILSGPLIFYVKPRLPITQVSTPRRISYDFLWTSTFWFLQIGNILEGLGFFVPGIYLPSYAQKLGLSTLSGSIVLALFNSTSVIGQVLFGFLNDRMHVTSVIAVSTIGATMAVFLFWGFSLSMPLLCIFSLLYGVFAGGFSSCWTGMIREVQRKTPSAETGSVFGLLCAGRGIGAVASGPLSEKLLGGAPWLGTGSFAYGTGYGGLIVFTGISAFCGGLSFVGKKAKLL